MGDPRVDVCVVGAGVAGIACAQGLVQQGRSVVLLDRLHPLPAGLKAEKIDAAGVTALLRLGFGPAVERVVTPLRSVTVLLGERVLGTLRLAPPEASMHYADLVNGLRGALDPRVDFRPGGKVVAFDPQADGVAVVVDDGTRVACRLVVLTTGEARHLVEPLGAHYTPEPPQQTFAAAFTLTGPLGTDRPVDSQTYHRPLPGTPLAYATFFRLGSNVRANLFCPGPTSAAWQRDLKDRPLAVLCAGNRRLAQAARDWQIISPVTTRKVQVARVQPPACPRIVALGDATHTIDPAGGGGLTFALTEAELLVQVYTPCWFQAGAFSAATLGAFYDDPRRMAALRRYFGAGHYIFALNHDLSRRGAWRRLRFDLSYRLAARQDPASSLPAATWQLPAPYLYEQYTSGHRAGRGLDRQRAVPRSM